MRRPIPKTVALMAAGVLACPAGALAGPVQVGETQGLGLLGPEVPEILKRAKTEPYALPVSCETVDAELAALDAALGPDADEPPAKTSRATKLVTKAIRGLIPHRDILRFVTGAGRKEDALRQAAMAGWARRGFLKGVSHELDCDGDGGALRASAPTGPAAAPSAQAAAIPVSDIAPAPPPRPDVDPEPLIAPALQETFVAADARVTAVNP